MQKREKIIDLAFDQDGNLYVLEIAHYSLLSDDLTGTLFKVAPDDTRTLLAMDGLVAPGGLVIGEDGTFYIPNFSVFLGGDQVICLDQVRGRGHLPIQLDEPDE